MPDAAPAANPNVTIVIFGASGDLTRRKLMPALYELFLEEKLPQGLRVVGAAIEDKEPGAFRREMAEALSGQGGAALQGFLERLSYRCVDLERQEDMAALSRFLGELEGGPASRLYYLALPPAFYASAVRGLGAAGMAGAPEGTWRRIVIEKPFGHDLESARELNRTVHEVFDESQVYRIDHYLGKETAQNILFFRFMNTIFEPVWNRNYVDHVQISMLEEVDVGRRGAYYETAGVLRDMFQNHMLQLLSLVAMEPPTSFAADDIRGEKVQVVGAVRPIEPADTVRGQYRGYREAPRVAPDSQTATFAAMRCYIDNWRWQDVPFYLRSGKALQRKSTEITIRFKRPPRLMHKLAAGDAPAPNTLSLCIQPNEGIHLSFESKVPETQREARSVDMEFLYRDSYGPDPLPDAYDRLLLDALRGDPSLFARSDAIEAAWELIDPVAAAWSGEEAPPLAFYEPGSWGPKEAGALIGEGGRAWRLCCACEEG